jgi:hypothetical protein
LYYLGKFVTGGFTDRYAVIAIIGFSVLIAFIAAKLNNNDILISAGISHLFCRML